MYSAYHAWSLHSDLSASQSGVDSVTTFITEMNSSGYLRILLNIDKRRDQDEPINHRSFSRHL